MNQELFEQLKTIEGEEQVIVKVNDDIKDALNLINFRANNLENTLNSIRENRYGFYNEDDVVNILRDLERNRVERENFIAGVGISLLGDNWRDILNELQVEFMIDTALPVIVFFKRGF